jgi:hypothetical protein
MNLVKEWEALNQREREEYESMKQERKEFFRLLGWMVRQMGGHVRIPDTVSVRPEEDFRIERDHYRMHTILRVK